MAHLLRVTPFLLLGSLLALPACDGAETGTGGAGGGGGTSTGTGTSPDDGVPADPPENDPAFTVTGVPRYLLVGDELTNASMKFVVRVVPPAGVTEVDMWIDGEGPVALEQDFESMMTIVEAEPIAPGQHTILLAEHGADVGFYKADFAKGHALYVMVSTDWDFPDVDDRVLDHHLELHDLHPELVITHLMGPYTFTDPAVPQARRDEIVSWVTDQRDMYGDEIGLHVHPRCTFVEAAGLPCLTQPSVAYPQGDVTGYTVRLGAYTRDEWNTMFAKADEIWASVGFGKPVAFRAGAWTLETHVAQALADSGFVVDSSPVNWAYMEEWEGSDLLTWNQQQWGPINDTSQPYFPTEDSILPGGSGAQIPLLLAPDNGIMVDYWTVEEIKGIVAANWSGQALEKPIQLSTGFHPAPEAYYSKAEYNRLDALFTHLDQYLASAKLGPVVYIRMSDATVVWK